MSEPDWEELGRQLERARGPRTANEVGRALGFSGKQLRNYERSLGATGRPPASRLMALARHYGVPADPWLALAGYEMTTVMRVTVDTSDGVHVTVLDEDAVNGDLAFISDRALIDELERRLRFRQEALAGRPSADDEGLPVGPDLYDLAAHTDGPEYVRDYERDVAPDEGA
jgi:transcriptional regulator with XRE-family HTH domain